MNHREILTCPSNLQDQILSSVYRIKQDDMHVKKETVNEHFKKPIKSYGRGRVIKKNRDSCYKEAWQKM